MLPVLPRKTTKVFAEPVPNIRGATISEELGKVFLPNRVLVLAAEPQLDGTAATVPLLENKKALHGKTTAYVCENRVCDLPAQDVATFAKQIRKQGPATP